MDLNSILEAIGNSDEEDKFYENLYEVIGCFSSSTTEQISTEYKKRVLHCHPDKVTNEQDKKEAEKQFQKLSIAYKILVDEKERKYYDKWRNGSIKINYKMWRDLVIKKGHAVHWQPPPKETLSITHDSSTDTSIVPTSSMNNNNKSIWNSTSSGSRDDLYEKFRNYEI
ncbi:DnaJ domain-containing protein [Glomus cerebriforme]|uniref:DnaJ domain-containing protein n=1 Tax=Glomus cerebriforme TaxID=658196 RepID=A0A397T2V2_9GLOM|nr:DnaJ domain-containing protein [Glomus cerebriforme]